MNPARFSGFPGRNARTAAHVIFPPRYVFIPLFIIFSAACLLLAGCTDEDPATPVDTSETEGLYPPELVVWEPLLGTRTFYSSINWQNPALEVFSGIEFSFRWYGTSRNAERDLFVYRYGWDIENLEEDDDWDSGWNPLIKRSAPRSFSSGVHVFYVEVMNLSGETALARVEIEVIPYTAERDLLWIDDYPLGGYIPSMIEPSEEAHDEFWTDICSMAPGFDPSMDIYDTMENNFRYPIPLSLLAKYKHVVWTSSSSIRTVWQKTVEFHPTPSIAPMYVNNLRMFLAAGGSALTCGRADRMGSLSEVFPVPPLFPASVTDELMGVSCDFGEYAEYSMARDDYYVTVIDKVMGQFKTGTDIPEGLVRDNYYDALTMALGAESESGLDFPDTLALDELVTCPSCFFNPMSRGFHYVEVYDPRYYMDFIGATSHPCFTPIYTIRTRNTRSPLHGAPIALKGTIGGGFGSCEPDRRMLYESYHFGFPLWFFEHEKVEQIAEEIFRSWEIR
jgi:hypothetical protein